MKELGYDVEYYLWVAVFAPKNIPAHAFQALKEATRKAVQEPDFRSAMDKIQVRSPTRAPTSSMPGGTRTPGD